ncbi:hypothetical protein ABKJ26_07975 [Exiguobacterium mexicanum]
MDLNTLLLKIYNSSYNQNFESLPSLLEFGVNLIPIADRLYSEHQMRKINKNLKSMQNKIESIVVKLEASADALLYKQEVFPIILKQMIQEPQEDKIKLVIDGFEYLIEKNITDLDMIYLYYDVLHSLRDADIIFMTNNFINFHDNKTESSKSLRMEKDIQRNINFYITNKLVSLGLVILKIDKNPITYEELKKGNNRNVGYESAMRFDIEKYELTPFGESFIDFFISEA